MRIASLVPSLTELLFALGLGDHVVGRTGFCIHPAARVRVITKLGGTKDVLLERLRELSASHLLVNVDENRLETIREIESWPAAERPRIVVTHPQGPEDVIGLVGQLLAEFAAWPGLPAATAEQLRQRAAALQHDLQAELAATASTLGECRKRVLYLIWREPWMTVARDTYIARMLARIGWQTLPAVDGGPSGAARYPTLAGDEPWLFDVDRVLLSSEPYAFGEQHLAEAAALCPNARVELVDGEALSWYGPRTLDGLRLLRQMAAEDGGSAAAGD
ncbi:helical backbone metal receptor [Piscinibacter sakaiensis]|uniref:helical backbone metal receptor n=1 Tax=Piscinibacter sakaiensis TaxID=1547922 RepID=UPI003AAD46A5